MVLLLSAEGESIDEFCASAASRTLGGGVVAILGDDRGISAETEAEITAVVSKRDGCVLRHVSLGQEVLFARCGWHSSAFRACYRPTCCPVRRHRYCWHRAAGRLRHSLWPQLEQAAAEHGRHYAPLTFQARTGRRTVSFVWCSHAIVLLHHYLDKHIHRCKLRPPRALPVKAGEHKPGTAANSARK